VISPTEAQSSKTNPISNENVIEVPPQDTVSGKSIFWKEGPAITLPVSYLLKNLKSETGDTAETITKNVDGDITLKVWILYKCEDDDTFTTGTFRSNSIFLKFDKRMKYGNFKNY